MFIRIRRLRRSVAIVGLTLLLAACGADSPQPTATLAAPALAPTVVPADVPATPTAIVVQPVATDVPAAAPAQAASEASAPIDFTPLLAVIEQEMATQQVPGLAIAILHKGVPLLSQGFGVADVAANRAVTPATPFRIGSITKPLTAIALLQLVEAGQVDLDAPVVTYLPEFSVSDEITVRQLLSHSSGLGDAAIPYGRTDAAALGDYVASLSPASAFVAPGTLFSYSNTGFNIVGRIIEVVSGMPYADYMASELFPVLGMAHTTFSRDAAMSEGLATGYYPSRGAPTPVDRDPDNGAEYPSGFAFSTVEDLARLASFLLSDGMVDGEQRLSPQLVQEMKRRLIGVDALEMGYGLGLLTRTRSGETTIGHNGTINGYAATMELMPSEELTVILLSNRNNYDPERIIQAAFDLFVEDVATPPTQEIAQEIVLDEAALSAYVGRYLMSSALPGQASEEVASEEVIVAIQDGHLTASLPGVTFELRAVGNDLFNLYVPQESEPVTQIAFMRDETGAVQYMNFTMHALMRVAG